MISQFKNLPQKDRELLLKAPVLFSIFAASEDHDISKLEKSDAVQLAHFRTFTADPILIPYYKEVEKYFKQYFEESVKKYAPFDKASREALKGEIEILNTAIAKLDKGFSQILVKSLSGYAEHVKKANKSLLMNFILPISIKGLTD
jgi:hypothetical protein